MSKPRVFVSSTYSDLKDLREVLWKFLTGAGYEPTVFERGGIYYDHTKPVAESCCDKVRECDMFVLIVGGRYGSPAHPRRKGKVKKFNSMTREEYFAALEAKIPTFTFVSANVLSDYETYKINKEKKIAYAHVEDPQIFELLDHIVGAGSDVLRPYHQVDQITDHLKEQCAEMLQRYLQRTKAGETKTARVHINGYKLFYYRAMRKLSLDALSKKTGIEQRVLRRLEKVRDADGLDIDCFAQCEGPLIPVLETALECLNRLQAGKADDFMTAYMTFHRTYKAPKKARTSSDSLDVPITTKALVFDFDGTLTARDDELTTWEKIWVDLGYTTRECADLHRRYQNKEFGHEEWCQKTFVKFKAANLKAEQLDRIAGSISLIKGARETIQKLRERGIRLYIVSGSIQRVIRRVLGDLQNQFESISANDVIFDKRELSPGSSALGTILKAKQPL